MDPLVCRVAPGQHLARQEQAVAMFPAGHFLGREIVEIDLLRCRIGFPGHGGIVVQLGRLEIGRARPVQREMGVARGRAVGDHGHRLARRMAGCIEYLHIEHGGQAAQALRPDPLRVHRVEDVDPQLLDIGLRTALLELAHIDRVHEAELGQLHAVFRSPADTDAEHTRRTPAGPHAGQLFDHPIDDIVAGVHHLELGLVLAPAALGRDIDIDGIARHHLDRQHTGRIVAGVAAREGGIGQDRGAQLVVGVIIGLPHAFIDNLLQAALRIEAAVHAPLHEDIDDAGVLANRTMTFGAHAAVGQDLCDRILGCRTLLGLVGFAQRPDIIHRVVIGDILEGVLHALDQILFLDNRHVAHRGAFPCCRFALPDRRVCIHRSKRLEARGLAPKATRKPNSA